MKKFIKRSTSLFLAVLMCFSSLIGVTATAHAATKQDVYIIDLPRGKETNKEHWGHPAYELMNGWSTFNTDYVTVKAIGDYEGDSCYCIEPGVSLYTGDKLSKEAESFWDNYPSKYNKTIDPDTIKVYLGRIMQYGYTGKNSVDWVSTNSSKADDCANHLATQLLVWETVIGERDENFNHVDATKHGKHNIKEIISSKHPLRSKIFSHYSRIEKSVKQHTTVPSFASRSKSKARSIELKWNGKNYSTTINDTNGVLANYDFSGSGLTFSKSGNSLTITAEKAPKDDVLITVNKKNSQRKAVITWTDEKIGPQSGQLQDIVTFGQSVSDPVKAYLNVKVSLGNAKLMKVSEDGEVANVRFHISGNGISKDVITNANGEINIANLALGNYQISEYTDVKYVPQDTQTVAIVSGQTASVHFSNVLKKFRVNVTKQDYEKGHAQGDAKLGGAVYGLYKGDELVAQYTTDSNGSFTTGKRIPYEGAAFEIYDSNNHRITMQYTYPQVTSIHTFYTNKEGYLITPEKLPYGDYTLKEVQAPYGYILDDTPIPFSISQENSSTDTGVTVVKVKARDVAQKGVINITKTGEIFSSVEENNGVYTPKYSVGNLKGAVFEIYAAEDITTLDGTVRYEQGTLVDTITTDDDGVAKSKELYLGKYTVIEKTAPNGYVHNTAKYDAELTYAGQNVSVTSTDISVYNDRQKVSVSLKKEMEEDKTFNLGKNNEISSVQFGVYANEDIKASNGDVIPKDALITFANCDKNGSIVFDCDLPVGFKWYVKEIATDAHYILSDTKYEFDTEYQGQDVKVIDIKVNNDKAIENNLIYGSVKGLKVDRETQEVIKGATFGLFKSDTTEFAKDNAILTAVTDENGIFTFSNIPYGEYLIKELKPADGYLDNEDVFTVTIKDNEQVVELTAINDKVPELKTTAIVNGKKEAVAKGEIAIKDTVEYKHLVPNTEYVIKGTLMDKSTGKPFKVKGKEITSTVKFVPDKTDGKVEVTFTFDGSAIKKDTELVVFETLYRDGVELTAHADLKDKGQTVTIVPPTPKTPKTSDNRNLGTWIGLGGVGLGAGIAALLLKLKMKKDEDE